MSCNCNCDCCSSGLCCDGGFVYPQVLVGHEAPDFTAAAVSGNGDIIGF